MYQCYAGFKFTTGNPMESIACTQDGSWSATPKCEGTTLRLFFFRENENTESFLRQIKIPFNFWGFGQKIRGKILCISAYNTEK